MFRACEKNNYDMVHTFLISGFSIQFEVILDQYTNYRLILFLTENSKRFTK